MHGHWFDQEDGSIIACALHAHIIVRTLHAHCMHAVMHAHWHTARALNARCTHDARHTPRYEGPKGGPGMKEMLNPTAIVMGAGLGQARV